MVYGRYTKRRRTYSRPYGRKFVRRTRFRRRPGYQRRGAIRSFRRNRVWKSPNPYSGLYKIKFHDQYLLDSGGANFATVTTFRGNSIYDPDYALGGGVPTGFTALAAQFRTYRVVACSIRVMAHPHYNYTAGDILIGIRARHPSDNAYGTAGEIKDGLTEGNNCVHRWMLAQSNPSIRYQMKMYRTSRQMIGPSYKDSSYDATFTNDPATVWYYDLAMSGRAADINVKADAYVTLTYYIKCYGQHVTRIDE